MKDFLNINKLQNDIDKVFEWSKVWSTELNFPKCKVVHFGSKNTRFEYTIGENILTKSVCEKDLGIFIKDDLKLDIQTKHCTSKANRMLGMIRKGFKYPKKELVKLLYTSLVRPHLEYAISSWSPCLEKDINEIEKIQNRATKLIPELSHLDYPQRLSELGLTDLKTRRIRGDLIQMFKIINNLEKVNFVNGINFNHNRRSNNEKYFLRRHSKVREKLSSRYKIKDC